MGNDLHLRTLLVCAALGLTAVACQGQTSTEPPIAPIRNMHDNPRYDPQERSQYFQDGRAMRPEIAGTVAREMVIDPVIDEGLDDSGSYTATIPEPVIEEAGGMDALVHRGQDRYGIYCVPCHGGLGDGNGMVPQVASTVGTIRPPTFHEQRIREMPDGQMYATIRNGIRNMPSYRHSVPVADRWAIVSYVRALQLSRLDARTAQNDRGGRIAPADTARVDVPNLDMGSDR